MGWPTRPPIWRGWPPRCRSWSWRRSSRTASASPAGRAPAPPGTSSWPWPTMAGAWPLERERCLTYREKAVREAGRHSTWTDPDPAYERAVAGLVERAYPDPALLAELEELVAEIAPAGRVKAAGLALLRLTSPGIPDTYQGTETEQLVLVDPDNRRPVAFAGDDSLKFRVTRTALRLRRDHPDLFTGYGPLAAPNHLVAFIRAAGRLAVVVTRLTTPGPADPPIALPAGPWPN